MDKLAILPYHIMRTEPTLVVFCKKPALHQGKQRLAKQTGAQFAYEVAKQLLACALEDAYIWRGPLVISPAHERDNDWSSELIDKDHLCVPQPEGNLGERIMAVDSELRSRGHHDIIFIGTDAPVLNADFYTQAQIGLIKYDIILGPARDGGVTLMGASRPWPDLSKLPWSSDLLGESLAKACRVAEMSITFLSQTYDIDKKEDLVRLKEDLVDDKRPARVSLRNWLVLNL
ncbi:MAG: DUF2064 domain-containing protein [Fibrobacteria bacterium]|nr:DUF2064 domain-containing protein [Fibrobacteria bacterium]